MHWAFTSERINAPDFIAAVAGDQLEQLTDGAGFDRAVLKILVEGGFSYPRHPHRRSKLKNTRYYFNGCLRTF